MVNKMNFRRKRWLEWKLYSLWLSFRFCCCSGADDHFEPICGDILWSNFCQQFLSKLANNCRSWVNSHRWWPEFFYREVVKALVRWAGSATVQRNTETSHFEKYKEEALWEIQRYCYLINTKAVNWNSPRKTCLPPDRLWRGKHRVNLKHIHGLLILPYHVR